MMLLRQFIGIIAFLLVGIIFIVIDILSWLTVVPAAALFPRWKEPMLRAWVRLPRDLALFVPRVAGARIQIDARIPCTGGVLIVMNHQSLIDIPAVSRCVPDGYPRMVAHHRYGRGIPLVSHMLSMYGHILVYPGRTSRAELDRLGEIARTSTHPIVIFPEGHRSRDGEIRPFKRAGLEAFLSAREWNVYVVVVDGLWKSGGPGGFMRTISTVRGHVEAVGPIAYDGRGRDTHDEFIDRVRRVMCDKLAEMRARRTAVPDSKSDLVGSVTGR
jgi:1-acyl-sn-glycerol-3-phosphate acyltransferase